MAERIAEQGGSAKDRDIAIGQLSVYLSEIEESAVLAAQDWADFYMDAVEDLMPGRP